MKSMQLQKIGKSAGEATSSNEMSFSREVIVQKST